jgi:archaellum component FlaC
LRGENINFGKVRYRKMTCDNCEIEREITQLKCDIKELYQRTEDSREKLTEIKIDLKYVIKDITEIKNTLNKFTEKPAQRWELIVTTIIIGLVSAGVGTAIGMLFQK